MTERNRAGARCVTNFKDRDFGIQFLVSIRGLKLQRANQGEEKNNGGDEKKKRRI